MEMIMATPGLWGLLCVPFFMSVNLPVGERGILFDGGISYVFSSLIQKKLFLLTLPKDHH